MACLRDYFFTPRTASFAALATRNLITVLAGILIFCCVLGARFPLLLHQFAEAGQDKFAVLFGRFVSESAERIEEYSSGLLIGLALLRRERVQVLF